MAEPFTFSALLVTTGVHVYYHIVGGMAHHRVEHFLERWREAAMDPRTGLPRNHDIAEASEAVLRAAAQLLALEPAGRLDSGRSWLPPLCRARPVDPLAGPAAVFGPLHASAAMAGRLPRGGGR